jgi:hypothetical protein
MTDPTDDELRVLRLRYEDVLTERDRLRDARAGVTGQLGPLPASAAIVIGLAGTVADKVESWALITAGGLLAVIVIVSILFGSLRPYRLMRATASKKASTDLGSTVASDVDEATWLRAKIELEQRLYGKLDPRQHLRLEFRPTDLQEAFDVERTVLNIVQLLFVLIISALLIGILVP